MERLAPSLAISRPDICQALSLTFAADGAAEAGGLHSIKAAAAGKVKSACSPAAKHATGAVNGTGINSSAVCTQNLSVITP